MKPPRFDSWLADPFSRFVALKRATGVRYEAGGQLLRAFDRYLERAVPTAPLRPEHLAQWLRSLDHLTPRGRDNAVGVVWSALSHARLHGAQVEPLPLRPRMAARGSRQRTPEIYSDAQLRALLAQARAPGGFASATCATLLGLLAATGLRIGEALALDVGDLDVGACELRVRRGKFGKARLVPIRESTRRALSRYLRHPRRPLGRGAEVPLFVSGRRRRLGYYGAREAVRAAARRADLQGFRPHDLRHTFAVRCVSRWYEQGRQIDELLPALSTYLGHVSVDHTRVYLRANGLLLLHAAARFQRFAAASVYPSEAL